MNLIVNTYSQGIYNQCLRIFKKIYEQKPQNNELEEEYIDLTLLVEELDEKDKNEEEQIKFD